MKERITGIVIGSLADIMRGLEVGSPEPLNEETRLYGTKGVLDSIALVSLIAEIEDRIAKEFGRDVILADERAMSQRLSPFGRVALLVEYIEQLLQE
jgi:acyl carrier protein